MGQASYRCSQGAKISSLFDRAKSIGSNVLGKYPRAPIGDACWMSAGLTVPWGGEENDGDGFRLGSDLMILPDLKAAQSRKHDF